MTSSSKFLEQVALRALINANDEEVEICQKTEKKWKGGRNGSKAGNDGQEGGGEGRKEVGRMFTLRRLSSFSCFKSGKANEKKKGRKREAKSWG